MEDGRTLNQFVEIKEATCSHFEALYTVSKGADLEDTAAILENIPSIISPNENTELMKEITEEEIQSAVRGLALDKAPGPDGFTIHLFRECWDIIKTDLKHMTYVQKSCRIRGCTNSSFLALIPKEANPSSFSRFQAISLCDASYKVLTKIIIATRLKHLLSKIISENQGSFISKRQIVDKANKNKGMIIKIDMANAFNKVSLFSFGYSF